MWLHHHLSLNLSFRTLFIQFFFVEQSPSELSATARAQQTKEINNLSHNQNINWSPAQPRTAGR